MGEVRRIRSATRLFSQIFIYSLLIRGARIVAPIVLAQHKEHERIGEAGTSMRRVSPIVIELTY